MLVRTVVVYIILMMTQNLKLFDFCIICVLHYIDDEKSKDDWIGSVGRSIVRCSSTYVSRGGQNQGGDKGNTRNTIDEEDDDSDDYSNSSNNPYFND